MEVSTVNAQRPHAHGSFFDPVPLANRIKNPALREAMAKLGKMFEDLNVNKGRLTLFAPLAGVQSRIRLEDVHSAISKLLGFVPSSQEEPLFSMTYRDHGYRLNTFDQEVYETVLKHGMFELELPCKPRRRSPLPESTNSDSKVKFSLTFQPAEKTYPGDRVAFVDFPGHVSNDVVLEFLKTIGGQCSHYERKPATESLIVYYTSFPEMLYEDKNPVNSLPFTVDLSIKVSYNPQLRCKHCQRSGHTHLSCPFPKAMTMAENLAHLAFSQPDHAANSSKTLNTPKPKKQTNSSKDQHRNRRRMKRKRHTSPRTSSGRIVTILPPRPTKEDALSSTVAEPQQLTQTPNNREPPTDENSNGKDNQESTHSTPFSSNAVDMDGIGNPFSHDDERPVSQVTTDALSSLPDPDPDLDILSQASSPPVTNQQTYPSQDSAIQGTTVQVDDSHGLVQNF